MILQDITVVKETFDEHLVSAHTLYPIIVKMAAMLWEKDHLKPLIIMFNPTHMPVFLRQMVKNTDHTLAMQCKMLNIKVAPWIEVAPNQLVILEDFV